ncbi:ATP-binding protein [Pseudomonas aeruginosa]|uniref:ATP-binding protein n=1 Tax=Pseudomonas aeruginosa TaxID=287 RepID=UPI0013690053|nr:ATP-binding protein [Pseudomonas aeruginosa]MWW49210.1 ATP-binding protein [Pseudomonas aeruginosa]
MSQLLKIVLIDSLCAGAKAEITISGNTSVNGTNGIGKSSFLKLIPVFYGAAPGQLVKAGSNRESFANWYLPNASSYIVFEYTNSMNAPRCAIMHRSGDSYAYRLVAHAWGPDLLYRNYESGELVRAGELIRHLAVKGIDCSPELQPIHYRHIIQFNSGYSHMEKLTDPQKRKLVLALRPSFSLAPKRTDFNGIDNVALALLASAGTFDTMKTTMAEILEQDNSDLGRTLETLNAAPFNKVLENRAGYLLMDELRPKVVSLSQLRIDHQATTRQLGIQKARANHIVVHLGEREAARMEALSVLTERETRINEEASARRQDLAVKRGHLQANFTEAADSVSKIESAKEKYEQAGMADLLARADNIGEVIAQRDLKQDHLTKLNAKDLDIRQVYDVRAQKAKDSASAQREEVHSRHNLALEAIQERQDELEDDLRRRKEETEREQRAELEEHEQQRNLLATAAARASAELDHLKKTKVLPSSQDALDAAQHAIDEQAALLAAFQAELAVARGEEKSLQDEQSRLVSAFQGLDKQRSETAKLRDALKEQLNAGAETMLGYLRKNHPSWKDNIARLVPVEILLRADLNPAMLESPQQSLYGLELALQGLSVPTFASDEALEQEIASLTLRLEGIQAEFESLDKQNRVLEDRFRKHAARLSKCQNDESQAAIELASRREQRKALYERAQDEYSSYVEEQGARAVEAQRALDEKDASIAQLRSFHGRHILELTTNEKIARDDLAEERARLTEGHKAALQRITEGLNAELQTIENDKSVKLRSEGIDDRENRRLEREINQLNSQIKEITDQRSIIESYRQWLENVLPQLPIRIAEMSDLEGQVARVDRQIADYNDEVKTRLREIVDQRKALAQEGQQDEVQARLLSGVLNRLTHVDIVDPGALLDGLAAQDIDEDVTRLMRQRGVLHKSASDTYRQILSQFRTRQLLHTPQGAAIEQIASQASNAAPDHELAWLEAAPSLQEYIDVSHPDQKTKLIMQAKNLSDELCDRRTKLLELHRSIQQLGRDATQKAREVLGAFAQIKQFEFRVTSRIQEMSFWSDLSIYDQHYRRWQAMGDGVMPTENFVEALENVARQINEGKFTSDLEQCFDVSVSCNDQGRTKIATNNSELIELSSTGLTKIIVAMIYVSLFELLRKDADFLMSIPIDEALELSPENYVALVNYFNQRGISMLACFPGGAPELLRQFTNRYFLERQADTGTIVVKEYGLDVHEELDELNEALAAEEYLS